MKPRIGYLIPELPGQTHIFFWREIQEMEAMGAEIPLISTRLPNRGIISHSWSEEAMARTRYLLPVSPLALSEYQCFNSCWCAGWARRSRQHCLRWEAAPSCSPY